jgi:TonB family protein
LFEARHFRYRLDLIPPPKLSETLPGPRLALDRIGPLREFGSSLAALLRGPAAPRNFLGDPFFRDCWIEEKFPRFAFATAILLQLLLIQYPPPIWNLGSTRTISSASTMELTWFGPVNDFPAILPVVPRSKATLRPEPHKPDLTRGADAFHPRQTILSTPLRPTHPRQTLIQPKAPQEPPKILPALPNIVQLAELQPERPKLRVTSAEIAALRPKSRSALAPSNVAAPEISVTEKQLGVIHIAASPRADAKPVLPVNPMSAPRSAPRNADANPAAPEISASVGNNETLIALSAAPAPAAPAAVPAGNLSARFSISPEGPRPGGIGGTDSGFDSHVGAPASVGGRGPEGIAVSSGNGTTASTSGLSIGPPSAAAGNALPSRPGPRVRVAADGASALPSDATSSPEFSSKLGTLPEKVLGGKRVYTLHVNMPNLTSASGSWILNFAELDETGPGTHGRPEAPELAGPVPLRKVDPKYPPELRTAHVDGEVVLYAIIRKEGGVDSIQLVHSLDPLLDANAIEALAQWKFRPAEKRGEPVDLEAVVHIPFRSRAPQF